MKGYNVAVIGYGVVGQNVYERIIAVTPAVYDKYKRFIAHWDSNMSYDIAFICVDTPAMGDGSANLDTSEVVNAINETTADIYVIKSTCPVGFTATLAKSTGKRIVYSPEYYGNTQHCNNFEFNFTILGGDKPDCLKVQQMLQRCYDARHTFRITSWETAELVKFMENSWLATKVSFCSQFFEIAKAHRVEYDELRELFILDPRVNPSHTFIYADSPYWSSHCLNKDVASIADTEECATLLRDIIKFNNGQKDNYIL